MDPSLKHLTLKSNMLLALTASAIKAEIHLLGIRLLVKHSTVFQFGKNIKNQNKVD